MSVESVRRCIASGLYKLNRRLGQVVLLRGGEEYDLQDSWQRELQRNYGQHTSYQYDEIQTKGEDQRRQVTMGLLESLLEMLCSSPA